MNASGLKGRSWSSPRTAFHSLCDECGRLRDKGDAAPVDGDVVLAGKEVRRAGSSGVAAAGGEIDLGELHLAPAVLEVAAATVAAILPFTVFLLQHELSVLFYRLLLELLDGQTGGVQIVQGQVGPHQRGIDVELLGEQPHPKELVIETLEDLGEPVPADTLDEDRDRGVVEDLLVDPHEAEPPEGDVLRYRVNQATVEGDVVEGRDQQRPDHDFGVHGRTAAVARVLLLQRGDQFGEVERLVDLDQQVVGVDEVPELAGGELKQRRVALVAVEGFQHADPRVLMKVFTSIVEVAGGRV